MKNQKTTIIGIILVISLLAGCYNEYNEKQDVIYRDMTPNTEITDNDPDWQDVYLDNILSVGKISIYKCTDFINEAAPNCYLYSHGSGFIVADNVIATNWHVAEYYNTVDLTNLPSSISYYRLYVQFPAEQTLNNNEFLVDWQEVTGTYNALADYDVALLQVNTLNREPVTLSETNWENAEILTEVMAMGYPQEFEFVATTGTITDILNNEDMSNDMYWIVPETKFYKTDAQIDGGNSGGPLFNKQGKVIGINFATYTTQVTSHFFALTTDYLKLVELNNVQFEPRIIRRPSDYEGNRLFSTKGELNPVWEYEYLGNFALKPGCLYSFGSSGDNFADNGDPLTPAFTNIDLWLEGGEWITAYPDLGNPIRTDLFFQPEYSMDGYLYIFMNQSYQTNPGWYEAWGWEWCPVE